MGKKGKNSSNGGGAKVEKIQAVVLADSFTETCRPISLEMPKVLFPLCNTPMLSYVLEFLESAKVDEVLVFCSSFAEKVKEFLDNSRWSSNSGEGGQSRMIVRTIASSRTSNAGDALRELDNQDLVTSEPFVLISGDVVCNIDLVSVLEAHKARKELDKDNVMTVVFKKASPDHRTRPVDDDLVVVLDTQSKQIVKYDNLCKCATIEAEASIFEEHEGIEFRYDLMDCNVDVCSKEMLLRISDEYDYEDLRNDFIRREVQNRELGHKIYGHIVQSEYAARVHCPRTYDAVCRDVIRRWAYPLVPDNNLYGTSFVYSRVNRYKESDVHLGWSATIGSDTVIGSKSSIMTGAVVVQSVVGRNCQIGSNAKVTGSHLWEGVVVGEDAVVEHAILCNNVVVMQGAHIGRGSILSFGVVIGEHIKIDPFARITCIANSNGEFVSEEGVVGAAGRGRLWSAVEEIDEDEVEENYGSSVQAKTVLERLTRRNSIGSMEYEEDVAMRWKDWKDAGSGASDVHLGDGGHHDDGTSIFESEISRMITDSYSEGLSIDNLDLEIGCFKRAENMAWDETLSACLPAILKLVDVSQKNDQKGLLKSTTDMLDEFKGLVEKMCDQGDDVETALLEALEKFVPSEEESKALFRPLFPLVLKHLWYDMEVLSESVIDQWALEREKLPENDPDRVLVDQKHTKMVLEHVRAASSSDSDGSSGSSSGSEDS